MTPLAGRNVLVTFAADPAPRALITEVLGPTAPVVFLSDLPRDRRSAALEQAAALLVWDVEAEIGEAEWPLLARSDFVQCVWAGVDDFPVDRFSATTRIAANVGAYARPMAEHILALTLSLAKGLCVEHNRLKRLEFDKESPKRELRGGVCTILGFGGIGRATADLARAFGMRIYAVNRSGKTAEPVEFVGTLADLPRVLGEADVVVVALPLTKATKGLIGRRELRWMRGDAILVNVARAAIVDEKALYEHLLDNQDFMAGLDVWWGEPFPDGRFHVDHPFLELPNVLASPHNSGVVPDWRMSGIRRATENLRRYLVGERPDGVVLRDDYRD